jgi:hypothetical protein
MYHFDFDNLSFFSFYKNYEEHNQRSHNIDLYQEV